MDSRKKKTFSVHGGPERSWGQADVIKHGIKAAQNAPGLLWQAVQGQYRKAELRKQRRQAAEWQGFIGPRNVRRVTPIYDDIPTGPPRGGDHTVRHFTAKDIQDDMDLGFHTDIVQAELDRIEETRALSRSTRTLMGQAAEQYDTVAELDSAKEFWWRGGMYRQPTSRERKRGLKRMPVTRDAAQKRLRNQAFRQRQGYLANPKGNGFGGSGYQWPFRIKQAIGSGRYRKSIEQALRNPKYSAVWRQATHELMRVVYNRIAKRAGWGDHFE